MAVNLSKQITSRDAKDLIARGISNVEQREIAWAAAPILADNDIVLMCEIPVDAMIDSIRMWSDDLGTTGDLNLGFYPGTGDHTAFTDASAVDEDALAVAIDVNAAATANVELRYSAKGIETAHQRAWQLAGLSARPDYGFFYLAFTASEATTATGDLVLHVHYAE